MSDIERLAGLVDVARARSAMVVLADRLASRAEFVAKGTQVETLMRRIERTQLQQDLVVAQALSTLAQARVELVGKQRKLGIVDENAEIRAAIDAAGPALEVARLKVRLNELSKSPPEQ